MPLAAVWAAGAWARGRGGPGKQHEHGDHRGTGHRNPPEEDVDYTGAGAKRAGGDRINNC